MRFRYRGSPFKAAAALAFSLFTLSSATAEALNLRAGQTITPVEMDKGDTLRFDLTDGRTRVMVLQNSSAAVLKTNVADTKVEEPKGGTLYHFCADVVIDGHPMTMERYVCSQESFYEPYVINGMRIWFDAVKDIADISAEAHGDCFPAKDARFVVQDAKLPICPQEIIDWCPRPDNYIDIAHSYNGDDCWLGPYRGASAHGGLDINHPRNTPIWSPIDFDDHYYFNSIAMGQNNNRWRGVRSWPDGSTWHLQTHHLARLLIPEHGPVKAGTHIGEAAGELVGEQNHSHFVFRIFKNGGEHLVDPWIIFREIFENNKRRSGAVRAVMGPLAPAKTGQPVSYSSAGSHAGVDRESLEYTWTFGDGGWSGDENPNHTYTESGIYPVTLTVDDGANRATTTQHVTVDGPPLRQPSLVLAAPDEVNFQRRPVRAMDVYGEPITHIRHSLEFLARPSRPIPSERTVSIENNGGGRLSPVTTEVTYTEPGADWLLLYPEGEGNTQRLRVKADASELEPGKYWAVVRVECEDALNSPQGFRVLLDVPPFPPGTHVTVDDVDWGFYRTPWFWVGPKFFYLRYRGCCNFSLGNGGRAADGEFVRFTPDLAAGRYSVKFYRWTPYVKESEYNVRIRHRDGESTARVRPAENRDIGVFYFDEGTDGFVEIHAGGSVGEIIADAIVFTIISD